MIKSHDISTFKWKFECCNFLFFLLFTESISKKLAFRCLLFIKGEFLYCFFTYTIIYLQKSTNNKSPTVWSPHPLLRKNKPTFTYQLPRKWNFTVNLFLFFFTVNLNPLPPHPKQETMQNFKKWPKATLMWLSCASTDDIKGLLVWWPNIH